MSQNLDDLRRFFQKATYTPVRTHAGAIGEGESPGDVLAKLNFIAGLGLSAVEVEKLRVELPEQDLERFAAPLDVAQALSQDEAGVPEGSPQLASVPSNVLVDFAHAVEAMRRRDLASFDEQLAALQEDYFTALGESEGNSEANPPDEGSGHGEQGGSTDGPSAAVQLAASTGSDTLNSLVAPELLSAALRRQTATPLESLAWASLARPAQVTELLQLAAVRSQAGGSADLFTLPGVLMQARDELEALAGVVPGVVAAYTRRPVEPVGLLHLERLEITPLDVFRGELVYSLPLAPREKVTLVHKEWSTYQEDFSRFMQDYLEDYSERGVVETEELGRAALTQSRHAEALGMAQGPASLDLGVTLTNPIDSGGGNLVEDLSSIEESRSQSRQVTARASARAIKDHRVSFSISLARGVETSQARQIANPNKDKSMQIDYYRRMRRWRANLFRWGVRMAWDVVLPDPGRELRRQLDDIAALEAALAQPFAFDLQAGTITTSNYKSLAAQYGATLTPPPGNRQVEAAAIREYPTPHVLTQQPTGETEIDGKKYWVQDRHVLKIQLAIPDNYMLDLLKARIRASFYGQGWRAVIYTGPNTSKQVGATMGGNVGEDTLTLFERARFKIEQVSPAISAIKNLNLSVKSGIISKTPSFFNYLTDRASLFQEAGAGWSGTIEVPFELLNVKSATITLVADVSPSEALMEGWRMKCWADLRAAAQARDNRQREVWRDQRSTLMRQVSQADALTLRRREREQVMRLALSWLLPGFDQANDVLSSLAGATGSTPGSLPASEWLHVLQYGEYIKFIHEAVDWDQLIYTLYPYFWDSDANQPAKLFLEHPDPAHREFLRAGAARVLLPIRPGYEEKFTALLDLGQVGDLPAAHRFNQVIENVRQANQEFQAQAGGGDQPQEPGELVVGDEGNIPIPDLPVLPGVLHGTWVDTAPTSALEIEVTLIPVKD